MARHITLWTKMFLAPRQGDRLFLYSPDPPRGGIAIRHRHKGDHQPHVHLDHAPSHGHAHGRHHWGHHHHDEHRTDHHEHRRADEHPAHERGHWHLISPLTPAALAHSILVVALQFVWLGATLDFDEGFDLPLPVSARSPPAYGLAG